MRLTIGADERVIFVGKTGTGKTTLARNLLAHQRRLVVCDGKGTLWRWGLEDIDVSDLPRRLGNRSEGRYRLPPGTDWDTAFSMLLELGPVVVYIDELYAVVEPGRRSAALSALQTRGRELGVSVWAATQRPTWVPLTSLSESEVWFVFRLQLPDDRRRVEAVLGQPVPWSRLRGHAFYATRAEWEEGILVKKWNP